MKEIKLSFAIKLRLERTDVNFVEEKLLVERERVFKEVLLEVLKWIEGEVTRGRPRCECGAEVMEREGRNPRKLVTLLGEVSFKRARYRCRGCRRERYPLDEALGLEAERKNTLGVRERALWAAVEVSYEKAEGFLRKFTGLEVSRGSIHGMAVEEGQRIERWEEERRREVFERGKEVPTEGRGAKEVMYVEVDGTAVNDRLSGEWMECKVGVSFSERAQVSRGRVLLLDKRCYGSFERAEVFGEKFFLECVRTGVLEAKRVFFIGDGAGWIKRLKEAYFPGAVGVLDVWHLERELKEALGEGRKALVERCMESAYRGEGVEILRELMRLSGRIRDVESKGKIVKVLAYVRDNLEWIGNIPKVKPMGSGPVEKQVDVVVCRRFKKRGMSWYRTRANPLLKLRLLKLNGQWDHYWHDRQRAATKYAA
ncbi:MAG: UPF0236 family transposase-like protein [Candidatus Binatia bacterium]